MNNYIQNRKQRKTMIYLLGGFILQRDICKKPCKPNHEILLVSRNLDNIRHANDTVLYEDPERNLQELRDKVLSESRKKLWLILRRHYKWLLTDVNESYESQNHHQATTEFLTFMNNLTYCETPKSKPSSYSQSKPHQMIHNVLWKKIFIWNKGSAMFYQLSYMAVNANQLHIKRKIRILRNRILILQKDVENMM